MAHQIVSVEGVDEIHVDYLMIVKKTTVIHISKLIRKLIIQNSICHPKLLDVAFGE